MEGFAEKRSVISRLVRKNLRKVTSLALTFFSLGGYELRGVRELFYFFMNREKASLDIFWLRDESLEESHNLPDLYVLAREIVEDLEAAPE